METLRTKTVDSCADECLECHRRCLGALEYCINKGGEFASPSHLRILRVCAELCRTNAFILESRSEFLVHSSALCAEVCDACEASCLSLGDDVLENCAKACRNCSDSCLAMTTSKAA